MSDTFSEHVFPKYAEKQVMKPQMDSFDDPTLRDFSLLNSSTLMKSKFKDESFEDEFIHSFLNAARELASDGREATDRPGIYVIFGHSYAMPVLYLTRHCMELAIKQAIRKCGKEPKTSHNLSGLWSSLLSSFPKQRGCDDQKPIEDMGAFVKTISNIDDNGTKLRYPYDNKGELTQDRPLFVNNEKVVAYLGKFVEQLKLIDFDSIKKDGK